jgi:hypothetical protein
VGQKLPTENSDRAISGKASRGTQLVCAISNLMPLGGSLDPVKSSAFAVVADNGQKIILGEVH